MVQNYYDFQSTFDFFLNCSESNVLKNLEMTCLLMPNRGQVLNSMTMAISLDKTEKTTRSVNKKNQ